MRTRYAKLLAGRTVLVRTPVTPVRSSNLELLLEPHLQITIQFISPVARPTMANLLMSLSSY